MKKFVFLFLLTSVTVLALGQRARINGYAAYVFDDKFDSYYDTYNYYNGTIKGGFQGGVGIEYMLSPRNCIELMYLRRSTTAPTNYRGGAANAIKNTNFDLDANFILLGTDGHMPSHSGKVEGYGGFFAGVCISSIDNPDNGDHASRTKFAWGARLGCNVWPGGEASKFGIKIQTQLLSSVQGAGGGMYFGTGGAGVGLSTYSSIYQFGLGGGLTYKIGK